MRAIARTVIAAALVGSFSSLGGVAFAGQADCGVPGVSVGDHIRVLSPELGRWRVSGRLVSANEDGLSVDPRGEGPLRHISWCSIERLEVARGTTRQTGRGARIGLLFPGVPLAAAGILIGFTWMVRIYRADPEPDQRAWRYRERD